MQRVPDNKWDVDEICLLIQELNELRSEMLEMETGFAAEAARVTDAHKTSASNLLHYLALRRRDIRLLQEKLASIGLSSLGRAESQVMPGIEAVLKILHCLTASPSQTAMPFEGRPSSAVGKALLEKHTLALLGPKPAGRSVRIMVTVPTEAGEDYALVRSLLEHGMDCMRVNCAHDNPDVWKRMIENLERAKEELGKHCRILMDVPGPKVRTGPVEPGPKVIKARPRRDLLGRVTAPARIWLTPSESSEPPRAGADACLPVSGGWLAGLKAGDALSFEDARGAARSMKIVAVEGANRWAESDQTSYIVPGTQLAPRTRKAEAVSVGDLAPAEQPLTLKCGDTLILTKAAVLGRPALYDKRDQLIAPARVSVTLPEVFSDVRAGENVWFDDGRIGGVVRSAGPDEMEVEITHARPKGEKLGGDKGINFPDSDLRMPPLTQKDLEALRFIVRSADLVGYSFVRDAPDVRELQSRLADLGGERLGIILKIETRRAFERLPELLLAAMRSASVGVMIARGDLAVECGYERLAEVQEEILWICEAAHVPVIWATQVLETLAKEGMPSRAEITDAAMGERAECVMLNKGPYVVEAVRALDDILRRMEAHQAKKRSMMRRLGLAVKYARAS